MELVLRARGAIAPDEILFGCGPIVRDHGGPIALEQIDAAVDAALRGSSGSGAGCERTARRVQW